MPVSEPALDRIGISELQQSMADGTISAAALVAQYFARIDALDGRTNAILETNPDAIAIAEARDQERRDGKLRGPLHGVPIVIKDNIDTADQMTTTAGSLALEGTIAGADAFIVKRLRDAGAVLLAKTNLSEWANFRSSRSSSGWSSRGGQTRNPYALDRSPGGSSSGSGVAVASGFCAAAIGTETDGSIVGPSAMNGIVGVKPSVGLVSRTGIIPIAESQDTAGPMTKSVADAAILLGVLAGPDPADPITMAGGGNAVDYTACLDRDGLSGSRIGVARSYCGFHDGVDAIVEQCLETLIAAGATVIDPVPLPSREAIRTTEIEVMLYEFKDGINRYLARSQAEISTLAALIAFNQRNSAAAMPYFGQDQFIKAQAKRALSDKIYRKALAVTRQIAGKDGIDKTIAAHDLDAIIAPTTAVPWLIDWINGDNRSGGSACLAAASGYPSITVPAGYLFGLPVGLSFFAGAFQEPTLFKFAYAFEKANNIRQPPKYLSTANILPIFTVP